MKTIFFILIFFIGCYSQKLSFAQQAREYQHQQKFDLAVEFYLKHIKIRLKNKSKPDWENPYVYYLDIGDIFLEQGDLAQAIKYYLLAEDSKVEETFVSDRLKKVALWYEEQGDLESALNHLEKYQERDPEFFNMMLDRLAKEYASQLKSQK